MENALNTCFQTDFLSLNSLTKNLSNTTISICTYDLYLSIQIPTFFVSLSDTILLFLSILKLSI